MAAYVYLFKTSKWLFSVLFIVIILTFVVGAIPTNWFEAAEIRGTILPLPPELYKLTVTSSPITGITFTINGTPQVTPYTDTLPEGSYTLEMPETQDGYIWSHWLEDGDTNRIKTIFLQGTTWTAVYTIAPPPPVGGKATPINMATIKPELQTPWIWLSTIILSLVLTLVYVKKRKRHTEINS